MAGTREMIKQQLPEKSGLIHASTLSVSIHPRKRLRKEYIFCEGLNTSVLNQGQSVKAKSKQLITLSRQPVRTPAC